MYDHNKVLVTLYLHQLLIYPSRIAWEGGEVKLCVMYSQGEGNFTISYTEMICTCSKNLFVASSHLVELRKAIPLRRLACDLGQALAHTQLLSDRGEVASLFQSSL